MFIAKITGFYTYHTQLPMRAFRYADWARDWVDSIHRKLNEAYEAGRTTDYLESAELYRVAKLGECVLVDTFDGLDRGDGIAGGWENECDWRSPAQPEYHGCSHTKVKGYNYCRHHKRDPRYSVLSTGSFNEWPNIPESEIQRAAGLR